MQYLMQISWKHQCPIEIAKAFTIERFFNKYVNAKNVAKVTINSWSFAFALRLDEVCKKKQVIRTKKNVYLGKWCQLKNVNELNKSLLNS